MISDFASLADALLAGGAIEILVGLAILRFALGLTDLVVGFGVVIIAVSVALSSIGGSFAPGSTEQHSQPFNTQASIQQSLRNRLANNDSSLERSNTAHKEQPGIESGRELRARVAVSDLKRGLAWGLKLLIPFLLIDLFVAHIFAMLEWATISASSVATPLKLIVFLTVGGWSQLVGWLVTAAGAGAAVLNSGVVQ